MSTNNQFNSGFQESSAENNVDLGTKFVTKSYLMDVYPYLNGLGNNIKTAGLWTWGFNNNGQLGDNTITSKSSPVQTVTGGTNWKQVASGAIYTAAIKTDGTLWNWGSGVNGRLGDNTTASKSSPVQTVAGGTNWRQVSGGSSHTAAIKTDGTLWLWGWDSNGELGDNTTTNKSSPVQTVTGGTNWRQVACGANHTAAVKTDGTLWLWGVNPYGGLGDNTSASKSSPVQTVAAGTNWRQVACGTYHTAAIKTDGTLWAWGYNSTGQLCDNTSVNKSSPVQTIAGGTNWRQVACGTYHTAAIKTDGTLWTWGYNNNGQLGDNTLINKSSPVQTVAAGTTWRQVSCGDNHTAAIKTDGTLWNWGYNGGGQLGDNTLINKSSPVQTIVGRNNWKQVSCGGNHSTAIQEMGDDF
jgi:alpha-tubulin suppressor-like RCC1 family protein